MGRTNLIIEFIKKKNESHIKNSNAFKRYNDMHVFSPKAILTRLS